MSKKVKKKAWYNYLYLATVVYLLLGFFNIIFAWSGLICFIVPLVISISGGEKIYCNKYCGRGQLLYLLGNDLKLSRNKPMPNFIKTNWFRYGFLTFFMIMFFNMLFNTYLVFEGTSSLREVVTLFWTLKLPWHWAGTSNAVSPWVAQFSFGFYSIMLTSSLLGIITMFLYKPRSWCVYCPMGTMTQGISKIKYKEKSI